MRGAQLQRPAAQHSYSPSVPALPKNSPSCPRNRKLVGRLEAAALCAELDCYVCTSAVANEQLGMSLEFLSKRGFDHIDIFLRTQTTFRHAQIESLQVPYQLP